MKKLLIGLAGVVILAAGTYLAFNPWLVTDKRRYTELEARAKVQDHIVRIIGTTNRVDMLTRSAEAEGNYLGTGIWQFADWRLNERTGTVAYQKVPQDSIENIPDKMKLSRWEAIGKVQQNLTKAVDPSDNQPLSSSGEMKLSQWFAAYEAGHQWQVQRRGRVLYWAANPDGSNFQMTPFTSGSNYPVYEWWVWRYNEQTDITAFVKTYGGTQLKWVE